MLFAFCPGALESAKSAPFPVEIYAKASRSGFLLDLRVKKPGYPGKFSRRAAAAARAHRVRGPPAVVRRAVGEVAASRAGWARRPRPRRPAPHGRRGGGGPRRRRRRPAPQRRRGARPPVRGGRRGRRARTPPPPLGGGGDRVCGWPNQRKKRKQKNNTAGAAARTDGAGAKGGGGGGGKEPLPPRRRRPPPPPGDAPDAGGGGPPPAGADAYLLPALFRKQFPEISRIQTRSQLQTAGRYTGVTLI